MGMFLERGGRLGADPKGGTVRRLQLGVLGLEGLQLAEQLVVFRVADGGRIGDVIRLVGVVDEAAELFGAGGGRSAALRHRPVASWEITAMVTPTSRSISSALARARASSPQGVSRSANCSSRRRR